MDRNERAVGAGPASTIPLYRPGATPAVASGVSPEHDSRFLPGAVLADRYRIIGLLGRGGMGEVYRADDLLLGQPVALKFLPATLSADSGRLAHFRSEVRLARQVSHANVCRVYDIGSIDGHHFLSMEFVDGEDLGSLLRRIGRLPADKALDIARQLCAGLAAAHDRGVLHRDLKPSNVMIDGRGQARITDFGLAAAADDETIHDLLGTPAYMAPELFAGQRASVRSDLYALGLVLYEIFSGRAAFKAASFAEIARLHKETTPSTVSSLIGEIHPAIERAIHRCLEKDASGRPASALAVAASLPGGDPLAAALARGETPSPELVAAAGDQSAVPTALAAAAAGAVGVMVAAVVSLSASLQPTRLVPLPKSPELLRERASEIARSLGYADVVDTSAGFITSEFLEHVATAVRGPDRVPSLRQSAPSAILYWYRQSPRPLTTTRIGSNGRTGPSDPPEALSGMASVWLTPDGRLQRFVAVPPQIVDAPQPGTPDWGPLFTFAGLDARRFKTVTPRWTPPVFGDIRGAWEGQYADVPDVPLRVEAAAFGGRPVFFRVVEPWTRPTRMNRTPETRSQHALAVIVPVLLLGLLVGAVLLTGRNLRLGRGDRRGATRLSLVVLFATLTGGFLGADHEAHMAPLLSLVLVNLAQAVLVSSSVWLAYMALEPHVRRRWPRTLISWARLLSGRLSDPHVGRDVLAGVALGAAAVLLGLAAQLLTHRFGVSEPVWRLDGFRFALNGLLSQATSAALSGMGILLLVFFVALLTRSQVAAAVIVSLFFAGIAAVNSGGAPVLTMMFGAATVGLLLAALVRFGLLSLVVSIFVVAVLDGYPLTIDLRIWYGATSLLMIGVVVALTIFGFRSAIGGRSLVGTLLDD